MEGGFYGSICLCMLLVMVAMLVFYSIFSCVVREDVEKLTYIPAAHESLFGNESPSAPFLILLQPLLRPVQPLNPPWLTQQKRTLHIWRRYPSGRKMGR